jgi:hypothetical protein
MLKLPMSPVIWQKFSLLDPLMQKRVWWWLELVVYMGLMLANPSIISQIRPWAHFIPTVVFFAVDGLSILFLSTVQNLLLKSGI